MAVAVSPRRETRWHWVTGLLTPTTPSRYRLLAALSAFALVVATVLSTAAASRITAATDRLRHNSGPAHVASQKLLASVAEADAAAMATYLSGDSDRNQRRAYEDAIAAAARRVDEIARYLGDDDVAHARVSDLSVRLLTYGATVQGALVQVGTASGTRSLGDAVSQAAGPIKTDVQALLTMTEATARADSTAGRTLFAVAGLVLAAVVATLAVVQWYLFRRSRRWVNPPLAVATLLVIGAGVWLALAVQRQQDDLRSARREGFAVMTETGRLASAAYSVKSLEALGLLSADRASTSPIDAAARDTEAAISARRGSAVDLYDAAIVAELSTRWERYRSELAATRAIASQRDAVQRAITTGNAAFNGVNFTIEAMTGANEDRVTRRLASAADRLRGVWLAMAALPLLALAFMVWGIRLRLIEYR